MPLVKVDLQWESPADVSVRLVPSRGRLAEEVTASRRSAAQSVVRRWTISDAFGMARISFRQQVAQAVKIMPAAGQIRPHELLHQMSSGDLVSHPGGEAVGDLMETRPYTHGDPLKRVLWRAYARTRRLLVRMPEKAIAPRQKTLAYLVADRRDEPAAGVARSALEQGVFGRDFLFCADGEQAPTSEVPEAIEQIVRSAAAVDSSGQGLADFMAVGQARGSRSCVVFAPVSQGPWLELVERESRARKGQLSVVLTVEDVRSVRTQSLWRRLVLKGDGGRLHSVAELRQVWDRLVRSGIGVTVIDRSSGHALHPSALSALSKRRFGGGA
jgi:uncharacterized protein (DUF58 family)